MDLHRTIQKPAPRVPFENIALSILGPHYELSLVLCGDNLAQRMNRSYREKTYSPNVLAFPYSKSAGEIFLNVRKAEREATRANMPVRDRVALLFVHACYHLVGYRHGAKMDAAEEMTLQSFGFGTR